MSFGFVTASGKGVQVSEQALQKAKALLESIDREQDSVSDTTAVNNDDAAVPSIDSPNVPPRLSFTTPTRNIPSSTFTPPANSFRRSKPFRSPAFISPRPLNDRNNTPTNTATTSAITPSRAKELLQSHEDIPAENKTTPQRDVTPSTTAPKTPSTSSSSSSECRNITPIKLLTPYCRNWRLCIKVVSVDEMRQFRGTSVFAFSGVDDDGIEIRICAFNQDAYKVAEIVKLDKMYYIRRASVKPVTKRFKRSQYDMEVIVTRDTEIIECADRPEISSPKLSFNFVCIKDLPKFVDAEVDVIGVIREIGETRSLIGKMGESLCKRDLQLVDDSLRTVPITLWGDRAKNFALSSESKVIVVKRVLVRSYQGSINLTTNASTKLDTTMQLPEVNRLREWYNENRDASFLSLSNQLIRSSNEHKWIGEVKGSDNISYFNITAMIININFDTAFYKGCANENCRKKLIEVDGDQMKCPKCGVISDEYKYFYTLSVEFADMSGSHWASVFDECAKKLLGESADELAKLRKYNPDAYSEYFRKPLFKTYSFRIVSRNQDVSKLQQQQYSAPSSDNNSNQKMLSSKKVSKMRWSVLDLMPIDYDVHIQLLEGYIRKYTSK